MNQTHGCMHMPGCSTEQQCFLRQMSDMANNRPAGERAKSWGEMTPRSFAELEKELDELKRYREREPLVQELLEAADFLGGELYPILADHDYNMRQNFRAAVKVSAFCISSAAEAAPAAADTTGVEPIAPAK